MSVDTPAPPAPVSPLDRIHSIDALRGFAVLGILIINVQWMSMIEGAATNPTIFPPFEGANRWVWILSHLLAEQKFMTIFSMLFGAGVILMASRVEARGLSSKGLHYRRMMVLLLIGLVHAYLIWFGDVLVTYALCGMLVYPFRNRAPRTLIIAGVAVVAVSSILSLASGWSMQFWPRETMNGMIEDWQPGPERIAQDMAAYRGSYLEVLRYRAPSAFAFHTSVFLFWALWRAGGMMLAGMGLFKLGVFSARRSRQFYLTLLGTGLFIGIPIVAWGILLNLRAAWAIEYSFFFGIQFNYWASLIVSMGWVALVMLACQSRGFAPFTTPLVAVGRMALTNYLMQSVLCTWIFYGYGLSLYGRVERPGQLMIVLGIWVFQLIVSPLWLRHLRFGPAEWFWRSLTYGRRQPMRM